MVELLVGMGAAMLPNLVFLAEVQLDAKQQVFPVSKTTRACAGLASVLHGGFGGLESH
jgi:hypothetical protein